jgi:hypothetical protein
LSRDQDAAAGAMAPAEELELENLDRRTYVAKQMDLTNR